MWTHKYVTGIFVIDKFGTETFVLELSRADVGVELYGGVVLELCRKGLNWCLIMIIFHENSRELGDNFYISFISRTETSLMVRNEENNE